MADSDRRVARAPLRSATKRRKKVLDKARLATRATRWDRLKTLLKMKDNEVAEILLDTLVNFLIIRPYPSASIGIASIPGAFTQFRFNTS